MTRWNRVLERAGLEFRLRLPHVAFNRRIGEFAAIHADTDGDRCRPMSGSPKDAMLPSADDNRYVESLMQPVQRRASSRHGSRHHDRHRQQARRFEYVKLEA